MEFNGLRRRQNRKPYKGWPWEKAIRRQLGLLGNCSIGCQEKEACSLGSLRRVGPQKQIDFREGGHTLTSIFASRSCGAGLEALGDSEKPVYKVILPKLNLCDGHNVQTSYSINCIKIIFFSLLCLYKWQKNSFNALISGSFISLDLLVFLINLRTNLFTKEICLLGCRLLITDARQHVWESNIIKTLESSDSCPCWISPFILIFFLYLSLSFILFL